MLRSLVGSEMCIRDRCSVSACVRHGERLGCSKRTVSESIRLQALAAALIKLTTTAALTKGEQEKAWKRPEIRRDLATFLYASSRKPSVGPPCHVRPELPRARSPLTRPACAPSVLRRQTHMLSKTYLHTYPCQVDARQPHARLSRASRARPTRKIASP